MENLSPDDRGGLNDATRAVSASSVAVGRFFEESREPGYSGPAWTQVHAQDQEARRQYAVVLMDIGWTVPYGLLDDLKRDIWPEGYEKHSKIGND